MQNEQRIKIAIQKQGRLSDESLALLLASGLTLNQNSDALLRGCDNYPVDILFIRDDDILTFIQDGVCQLGIVGENILIETDQNDQFSILQRLGFGQCRLCIAVPNSFQFKSLSDLQGLRIATSYPRILQKFSAKNNLDVTIVTMSGSVEIAPSLGMADAILDLVSSGKTLAANGLREVVCVLQSEALLVSKQGVDNANF